MIKNAIIYDISETWNADFQALEEAVNKALYQPCTPSQEKASGWVEPRGEKHGALVENIGGQWILRYRNEKKLLPSSVIQEELQKRCERFNDIEGRAPGRKEKAAIKEEVMLDLLPKAFSQRSDTWVWIDPQARTLVIDATNQGKVDEIVSVLVEHLPLGFAIALLQTEVSPQTVMTQWLLEQDADLGFNIETECELKATDDSGSVVKYNKHNLDIEEIRQHIKTGKLPSKLALSWQDKASFVLDSKLALKKIKFNNVESDDEDQASSFDADFAIATGILSELISDLKDALS